MEPTSSSSGATHAAIASEKHRLRLRVRARRRAADADPARGDRVADAFLSSAGVSARLVPGAVVAAYVSLPWEPPTGELRQRLRAGGCHVYVPVAGADRELTWVADTDAPAAAWGVPGEESAPAGERLSSAELAALGLAVVCVPALAATRAGERLGQGGGYYDTFLSGLARAGQGGPLRMAVVGPDEVLEALPIDAHDEPVDELVIG